QRAAGIGERRTTVEDLVDVVVDAFTEEQDGLAPTVYAVEPLRDVSKRLERPAPVVCPLDLRWVGHPIALLPEVVRPYILLHSRQRRRVELGAECLVDGCEQQPFVVGQILTRVRPAGGVNNRHQ